MRIILFTGKGGVGKTCISAATALRLANLGYKTIVMSADAAHSLSDSFSKKLGDEPVEIVKNLYGQEIDSNERIQKYWGPLTEYIEAFLGTHGFEGVAAEELSAGPGVDELFSLMNIKKYDRDGDYDVLIVDCAPTAGTIQLLSLPEISQWYMEHIFSIQRQVAKVTRPIAQKFVKFPIPTDNVYAAIELLYEKIDGMKETLTDEKKTSIRLVINPERMVIMEAQREYTYLSLFGFLVDCIIVNRVMPEAAAKDYFARWKEIQAEHLKEIDERFLDLPIFHVKWFEQEVVGLELLQRMAQEIYGENDPIKMFYQERPISMKREENRHLISISLPNTLKEELDVWVKGESLIVKTPNYKRNILLPRSFWGLPIQNASYKNGRLNIIFGDKEG